MAFSEDDFSKVWASTSPLTPYEFSESNYKEGWNFIGGTPPARQMWDSIQKKNDEKTKFLYELAQMIVPVGVVQAFAGNTTPDGWLLCDGSAVSRTDYADLYAIIGDTYGSGDGTSTFNLPDLTDKFVQGNAVAGAEKSAGLPNIEGIIGVVSNGVNLAFPLDISGAFTSLNASSSCTIVSGSYTATGTYRTKFDASVSSSIYGGSDTVQPPALTMRYIIKY